MTGSTSTTFSAGDIEGLAPALKVGLLATTGDDGLPHVTLLSSLRAASPTTLSFGQFTEGRSKINVRSNPKAGFLVMSLAKEVWRGTATFTGTTKSGPDYDAYNAEPLFRYNAYFGIHTVYYLDLVGQTGRVPLPMGGIVVSALATAAAAAFTGSPRSCAILNPWTRGLLSTIGNLKFAAWVGADGWPRIVPVLQARAAAGDRVIFSPLVYGDEVAEIPAGATLAIFGMTLQMEDVLVRGRYEGSRRLGGIRCGVCRVDWVYNPMPPVPGQVYPPLPLEPVRQF